MVQKMMHMHVNTYHTRAASHSILIARRSSLLLESQLDLLDPPLLTLLVQAQEPLVALRNLPRNLVGSCLFSRDSFPIDPFAE
jgi:hypothetical protein